MEIKKIDKSGIIKELREKGYKGKLVTYQELQALHSKYGKGLSEKDFAIEILGLSYSNYGNCKNQGQRATVLKEKENSLSEEEKEGIIKKLKKEGYAGKLLTYEELQLLHSKYGKDMTEQDFALEILGLGYSNYRKCKSKVTRVRILKEKEKSLTEEAKKKIIKKLKEKGYEGKSITYEELQALHRKYGKEMLEQDFATKILGLSYSNYMACKNRGQKVKIKDPTILSRAKEIEKLYLKTPGYYSKETIDKICSEYQITIEEFLKYVVFKGFYDTTLYVEVLEQKGELWIGKAELSNEFVEKNIELIQRVVNRASRKLCNAKDQEDYAHDIIIYIIENMGSYERNLGDNIDQFGRICYLTAKRFCERCIVNTLKLSKRYVGLNRTFRTAKGKKVEVQYEDKRVNVENEAIEKAISENEFPTKKERRNKADECINLLMRHINEGLSREETLRLTAQEMRIEPAEMIKYMQEHLITKGKVRVRKSGMIEAHKDEETR